MDTTSEESLDELLNSISTPSVDINKPNIQKLKSGGGEDELDQMMKELEEYK